MVSHKAIVVDASTGVIESECMLMIAKRKRNAFGKDWIAMSQRMFDETASIKRVDDYRVLHKILAKLGYGNALAVTQREIAEELQIDPSNVSKSFKRLLDLGIILEGPKIGPLKTYRLNPAYGWKGKGSEHVRAIREF